MSLDKPNVLTILILPIKATFLFFFQLLSVFSKEQIIKSLEKCIPRAYTGSWGHLKPNGLSLRDLQHPNHSASVFFCVNFEPTDLLEFV